MKTTNPYRSSGAVDPAKRDTKRVRNGVAMLDFRTEQPQLAIELMITTRARSGFLLGNTRLPCRCLGQPIRIAIGDHRVDQRFSPCKRVLS